MFDKSNQKDINEISGISLFLNGKSPAVLSEITMLQLLESIKSGRINDIETFPIIDQIRQETDKEKRKELKLTLPAVTVSGCFNKTRKAANIIKHSGFIQVDFDDVKEPEKIKEKLQNDSYTFALFTSPSGNGLKAIVKIFPDEKTHPKSFVSLEKYYRERYALTMDKSCKDVSRLMFLSFDKDIFINQDAILFEAIPEIQNDPDSERWDHYTDKRKEVERIIYEIERRGLDITVKYEDWIKTGFAFASYFGEAGRDYFHTVSRFYPGYNYDNTDRQFNECLKDRQKGTAKINSFFHIAKQNGIDISRENSHSYLPQNNIYSGVPLPAIIDKNRQIETKTNCLLTPIEIKEHTQSDSFLRENGFIISHNGYIIEERAGKGKSRTLISNFIMQFLYQFPDGSNNAKYLIKLQNRFDELALLEITAKDITGLNAFKSAIKSKGNFHIYGSPNYHFDRMQEYHNLEIRMAKEVTILGYQSEGDFYAFSNGIISESDNFKESDKMGMIDYKGECYYLPAFSDLNKESGNFINERKFIFKPGIVDLYNYTQLMMQAYGISAIIGISYSIAAMFRDVIYNSRQTFPYLFLFGLPGVGKTSFTDLLLKLFGDPQDGVSLNNISTAKGMARKTAQLKNALVYFKEYSNAGMDNNLIHFLKTAYDGIGYERAQTSNDNRTNTTRVNSGIIIDGNEIPEKNSAVFSRCILLQFSKTAYTAEQRKAFEQLKNNSELGLGNVFLSIWKHRAFIVRDFESTYKSVLQTLKHGECANMENDRFAEHIALLLAPFQIMEIQGAKFAFNSKDLLNELVIAAKSQNEIFHQTNEIQQFLNIVEILSNDNKIIENKHYRQETKNPNIYSFVFNEIYHKYLEHSSKIKQTVISENSLKSLMIESGFFIKSDQKNRSFSHIDNRLKKSCYRLDIIKAGIKLPTSEII